MIKRIVYQLRLTGNEVMINSKIYGFRIFKDLNVSLCLRSLMFRLRTEKNAGGDLNGMKKRIKRESKRWAFWSVSFSIFPLQLLSDWILFLQKYSGGLQFPCY